MFLYFLIKEHLEREVLSFESAVNQLNQPRSSVKTFEKAKEPLRNDKTDIIKDTFDKISRDQDFSECCARGEPKDIERLKDILLKDPKK